MRGVYTQRIGKRFRLMLVTREWWRSLTIGISAHPFGYRFGWAIKFGPLAFIYDRIGGGF